MKILVIVGNGFDLGHSLPTTFSDFIKTNNSFQKKYKIFQGENWNNIEANYKQLLMAAVDNRESIDVGEKLEDIISCYGYNKYGEIDYVFNPSDFDFQETEKIKSYVQLLNEFECDFLNYLKENCGSNNLSILTPKARVMDIVKKASYILNFNYTNVLEEVYHIERVKHIHGNIYDNSIAIGTEAVNDLKKTMIDSTYPTEYPCRNKYDFQETMKYYEEDDEGGLHENQKLRDLFDEINTSVKEKEIELFEIIDKKNKDALYSRKEEKIFLEKEHFDEIIILGHSIGDADMSVFEKINKDAILKCYFHEGMSSNSFEQMKENLERLQIDYKLIPNGDLYK